MDGGETCGDENSTVERLNFAGIDNAFDRLYGRSLLIENGFEDDCVVPLQRNRQDSIEIRVDKDGIEIIDDPKALIATQKSWCTCAL